MTRLDRNIRRCAVVIAGVLSGMASAAVLAHNPPAAMVRVA